MLTLTNPNVLDIGFDAKGSFLYPSGGYDGNFIIFGADMSSPGYANNKRRSILVLCIEKE